MRKRQRAHHGAAVAAIEKIEGELQHTLDQLEAEQKPGPEEVASQLTRLQVSRTHTTSRAAMALTTVECRRSWLNQTSQRRSWRNRRRSTPQCQSWERASIRALTVDSRPALCCSTTLCPHVLSRAQDAVCTEPLADQPGLLQRAVLSHFHRAGVCDPERPCSLSPSRYQFKVTWT